MHNHVPIYNFSPRLCHVAPGCGLLVGQWKPLQAHTDWLLDSSIEMLEGVEHQAHKMTEWLLSSLE